MSIWFATVTPAGAKGDFHTRFTVQKEHAVGNEPFYTIGFFPGQHGSEAAEETNIRLMERVHHDMLSENPHTWNTISVFAHRLRQRWKEKWKRNPNKYSVSGTSATVAVIKGGSLGVFQLGNSVALHVTNGPNGCATSLTADHSLQNQCELQRIKLIDPDCTSIQEMTRLSENFRQRFFRWNPEVVSAELRGDKSKENNKAKQYTNKSLRYLDCPTRGIGYIFAHSQLHNSQETICCRPHESRLEIKKIMGTQYLVMMSPSMAKVLGKSTVQSFFQYHPKLRSDCAVELVKIAVQKFESVLKQIEDSNSNKMKPHHHLLEMLSINIEDFSILIVPIEDLQNPRSWNNDVVFNTTRVQYGNRVHSGYYGILHAAPATGRCVPQNMVSLKSDNLKIVLNDSILQKMRSGHLPRTQRLWEPAVLLTNYDWKRKMDDDYRNIGSRISYVQAKQPGTRSSFPDNFWSTYIPAVTSGVTQSQQQKTKNANDERRPPSPHTKHRGTVNAEPNDKQVKLPIASTEQPNQPTTTIQQPVQPKRRLNLEEYLKRRSQQDDKLQKGVCDSTDKVIESACGKNSESVTSESSTKEHVNANPVSQQSHSTESSIIHSNVVMTTPASKQTVAAPSKSITNEHSKIQSPSKTSDVNKSDSNRVKEQSFANSKSSEPTAKSQSVTKTAAAKSADTTAKSQSSPKTTVEPAIELQSTTKKSSQPTQSKADKISAKPKVTNCEVNHPEENRRQDQPSIVISLTPGAQPKTFEMTKSCNKQKVEKPSKPIKVTDSKSRDKHKSENKQSTTSRKETVSPKSRHHQKSKPVSHREGKASPSSSKDKNAEKCSDSGKLQKLKGSVSPKDSKSHNDTKRDEKLGETREQDKRSSNAKKVKSKKPKAPKLKTPMKLDELMTDLFEGDDAAPIKTMKWVDISRRVEKKQSKNSGGKITKTYVGKSPKETKENLKMKIVKDKSQQWQVSSKEKLMNTTLDQTKNDKKAKDSNHDRAKRSHHKTKHSRTSSKSGESSRKEQKLKDCKNLKTCKTDNVTAHKKCSTKDKETPNHNEKKQSSQSKEIPVTTLRDDENNPKNITPANGEKLKISTERKNMEEAPVAHSKDKKPKSSLQDNKEMEVDVPRKNKIHKSSKDSHYEREKSSRHNPKEFRTDISRKEKHSYNTRSRCQPYILIPKMKSRPKHKESSNPKRNSEKQEKPKKSTKIDTATVVAKSGRRTTPKLTKTLKIILTDCVKNPPKNISRATRDKLQTASTGAKEKDAMHSASSKDIATKETLNINQETEAEDFQEESKENTGMDTDVQMEQVQADEQLEKELSLETGSTNAEETEFNKEPKSLVSSDSANDNEETTEMVQGDEEMTPFMDYSKHPEPEIPEALQLFTAQDDGTSEGNAETSSAIVAAPSLVPNQNNELNQTEILDQNANSVELDQQLHNLSGSEPGTQTTTDDLAMDENSNSYKENSNKPVDDATSMEMTVASISKDHNDQHRKKVRRSKKRKAKVSRENALKHENIVDVETVQPCENKPEKSPVELTSHIPESETKSLGSSQPEKVNLASAVAARTNNLQLIALAYAETDTVCAEPEGNVKQCKQGNKTGESQKQTEELPDKQVPSSTELIRSEAKRIITVPDSLASENISLTIESVTTDDVIGGSIPIPTSKDSVAATGDEINTAESLIVHKPTKTKQEGNFKSNAENIHQKMREPLKKHNATKRIISNATPEANAATTRLTEILNRLSKKQPHSDCNNQMSLNSSGVEVGVLEKATSKRKQSKGIITQIQRTHESHNAAEGQPLTDIVRNKDVENPIAIENPTDPPNETSEKRVRLDSPEQDNLTFCNTENNRQTVIITPVNDTIADPQRISNSISKDQTATNSPIPDTAGLDGEMESMDTSDQAMQNMVSENPPEANVTQAYSSDIEQPIPIVADAIPQGLTEAPIRLESNEMDTVHAATSDSARSEPFQAKDSYNDSRADFIRRIRPSYATYGLSSLTNPGKLQIVLSVSTSSTGPSGTALNNNFFPESCIKAFEQIEILNVEINLYWEDFLRQLVLPGFTLEFTDENLLNFLRDSFTAFINFNMKRDTTTENADSNSVFNKELHSPAPAITESQSDIYVGKTLENSREATFDQEIISPQNHLDLAQTEITVCRLHVAEEVNPDTLVDNATTTSGSNQQVAMPLEERQTCVTAEPLQLETNTNTDSANEKNLSHPEFTLSAYQPQLSDDDSDCDDIHDTNIVSPQSPFRLERYEPQLSESESEDETDPTEATESISLHESNWNLTNVSNTCIKKNTNVLAIGESTSDSEPKFGNQGGEHISIESNLSKENAIVSDTDHSAEINNNEEPSEPNDCSSKALYNDSGMEENSSETDAEFDEQESRDDSDDDDETQAEVCKSDEKAAAINKNADASVQTENHSESTYEESRGASQEIIGSNTNDVCMETIVDAAQNRAEKRKGEERQSDAPTSKHLYIQHPYGFYPLPLRREDCLVTSAVQTEPLELVQKPVEKPEAVFVIQVNHNPEYNEGFGTQAGNLPFHVQVPLVVPLEKQSHQTGSVERCEPKRKRRKLLNPKPIMEFSQRHSSHNFQQRMVRDATIRMEDVTGILCLTDIVAPPDPEEFIDKENESEATASEQEPAAKGKSRRRGKKGGRSNKNDTQNGQAVAGSGTSLGSTTAGNSDDNNRSKRKRGRPRKWATSQDQ